MTTKTTAPASLPVHPAARKLLDAIAEVAGHVPSSPQDAAALLLSLGGDGTGARPNAVAELLDAMVALTVTTRKAHRAATLAAIYAEEAVELVRDSYEGGMTGEFAVGQAVSVLTAPHVVPNFDDQFAAALTRTTN